MPEMEDLEVEAEASAVVVGPVVDSEEALVAELETEGLEVAATAEAGDLAAVVVLAEVELADTAEAEVLVEEADLVVVLAAAEV